MPPQADPVIEVRDWAGVVTNADARRIPAEAFASALNLQQLPAGLLRCRKGIQKLSGYTDASPTSYDLVSAYLFSTPQYDWIVTHDTNGVVRGRNGSSVQTLKSSFVASPRPACFVRTRQNELIGVNGTNRGIRWDNMTSAAETLGIDPPSAAPTVTSSPGSGALIYRMAYRYADDTRPTRRVSNTSDQYQLSTVTVGDTFTWTIVAGSDARVDVVELWRTTQNENDIYYLVARLGNSGTITTVSNNSGTCRFTCTTRTQLAAGAKVTISGLPGLNGVHTVTAVNETNKTFDTSTSYASGSGGAWVISGFVDTISDSSLLASVTANRLIIVHANGTPSALRHTVPPEWASVVVAFQDRYVYGVPAVYRTGTVSTTAGSNTVTGSGTAWTSNMAGRYLVIPGETRPLRITTVNSATSITTDTSQPADNTVSGSSYRMVVNPEFRKAIIPSEIDLPESCPIENEIVIQENTDDPDDQTAMIAHGSALYVFMDRHVYRVTWIRQPQFDANVTLHDFRGAINQQCVKNAFGHLYVLDQLGVYRMSRGGLAEPISGPIQDLWRDGTLDLDNSAYWHAQADLDQRRIKWFVSYVADNNAQPQRWIEYDLASQAWSFGSAAMTGFGCGCSIPINGQMRVVLGGQRDLMYLTNEGNTDFVSAQVRGTCTSSTSTTLTDSTATFASTIIGAPVAIIGGTGKGQIRRITAQTSTQLTVDSAWTTNPDTDSVYLVGAVEWNGKTKMFELVEGEVGMNRGVAIRYQPTAGASSLDIRRFFNGAASADSGPQVDQNLGNRLTRAAGDSNYVLDLLDENSVPGYAEVPWTSKRISRTHGTLYWAVQLAGFQGDYAHSLTGLDFHGVEPNRSGPSG